MGYLDGFKVTLAKLTEARTTTSYPEDKREKQDPQ